MAGRIAAIIFDLDGTLVDTVPDLRNALNKTLAELGREPLDTNAVKGMIGDGIAKFVERGFAATGTAPGPKELEALVSRYSHYYDQGLIVDSALYPGVADTLKTLNDGGHQLGVCTNKPYAQSVKILNALNIEAYFHTITGGDSTDRLKPDPKPLLRTLEKMNVPPDAAVMVGDSANDVEAARRAGIASIVVSYGYSDRDPETLGADKVIEDFAVIPQVARELEAA